MLWIKTVLLPVFVFLVLAGSAQDSLKTQEPQQAPTVLGMLIFPLQGQHVHGSSIVRLPNGDWLATWFQGSGERTADDVKIMGARLKSGSTTWSLPFLMADTHGLPDCNPVLFLNNHHKLFLIWIAVQAHRWECSILRYRTSIRYDQDGPPVWNWQDDILLAPDDRFSAETASRFAQLPPNHHGSGSYAPNYDNLIIEASRDFSKRSTGWMTRIKPLILEGGRILLPLYSDGFNFSLVAISDDDGDTWRPSLPIVGRGNVQPALVRKKDGKIVAFMRDNGDSPARVQYSESTDSGETWSAAQKTTIPNEASVELITLNDGRWAFVGNDEDDGRYRLSLYISDDEGATWKWKKALENTAKDKGRFSYPCLIQTNDGLLHITYSYAVENGRESIKYVVIDPASVTATGPADPDVLRSLHLRPHLSVNKDSFYVAYRRNPALWDAAFAFLRDHDLDTMKPGRYPIIGEQVFATISEAPSHKKEEVKWESHRDYIDLHYIIKGKEMIGVADTSTATIIKPYTPDVINYTAGGKYYTAGQGEFFLFFPNDAHRPTIKVEGYDVVKKIVIKIQTKPY